MKGAGNRARRRVTGVAVYAFTALSTLISLGLLLYLLLFLLLKGAGAINPANVLDFKMAVKLHAAGMMASVANTSIPFLVQGTCADPVFRRYDVELMQP